MSRLPLTVVVKDYDYIYPLLLGDVQAEGIELTLDRKSGIAHTESPETMAGETSFSRYLIRFAQGDRNMVGIPFFCYHGFRQRCFFVRRGSPLRSFKDLAGKRIGTNAWPDTGNTWSRAALREQGVDVARIQWMVGRIDETQAPKKPSGEEPSFVQVAAPDQCLRDLLIAGELDALMCPLPPKDFYKADSAVVRLFSDFRKEEQDYYRRTGIYPGHHILVVKRALYDKEPWVVRSLYNALDESKLRWNRTRAIWAEFSPWQQADIEEAMAIIGPDWHPSGVQANWKVIETLCSEEYAQGLIKQPIDPKSVFADFERVMNS